MDESAELMGWYLLSTAIQNIERGEKR